MGVSVPNLPGPPGTIRHPRRGRRAWTITLTISSPRPDTATTRPVTRAYTRTTTPPPRRGTPRRTARRWRFRSEAIHRRTPRRSDPRRARRGARPRSPAPAGWSLRPARTRTCCRADTRGHYETVRFTARARARLRARSAIPRTTSTRRRRGKVFRALSETENTRKRKRKTSRRLRRRRHRPPRASLPGRPRRARGMLQRTPAARVARPTAGRSARLCARRRRSRRSAAKSPARALGSSRSPATCWKLGSRARPGVTNASGVTDAFVTPHATAVTAVKNRSSFCDR